MDDDSLLKEASLLLVDDDAAFLRITARSLEQRGVSIQKASSGDQALSLLSEADYDVAVLDMAMPGLSGIEVLEEIRHSSPDTEVVILTAEGTIKAAVQAMRLGAHDFLTKPVNLEELLAVLTRAYQSNRIRKENRQFKEVFNRLQKPFDMLGDSEPMKEVFRLIERAAPSDQPILIQGESGTGKELVAQALHRSSGLADKPFVVVNCAALPEHLLESELFGHEKGAFTGAAAAKPGLFEVADGGTLFIDEIGELAGSLQPKLLRVLEDGLIRRVGSTKSRKVRVRLITASNRDMAVEVEAGRFREDLYYRIDVMTIALPPLHERGDDVTLLARYFAGRDWRIDLDALRAIQEYHWPGNVRQLINAVRRAKILADDEVIHLHNLPPAVQSKKRGKPLRHADSPALDAVQREHIIDVIASENGNKVRAARALGISRRTLYRLIDKYGI